MATHCGSFSVEVRFAASVCRSSLSNFEIGRPEHAGILVAEHQLAAHRGRIVEIRRRSRMSLDCAEPLSRCAKKSPRETADLGQARLGVDDAHDLALGQRVVAARPQSGRASKLMKYDPGASAWRTSIREIYVNAQPRHGQDVNHKDQPCANAPRRGGDAARRSRRRGRRDGPPSPSSSSRRHAGAARR